MEETCGPEVSAILCKNREGSLRDPADALIYAKAAGQPKEIHAAKSVLAEGLWNWSIMACPHSYMLGGVALHSPAAEAIDICIGSTTTKAILLWKMDDSGFQK